MRIYGGKDYYDVGLSYGVDKAIVLVRSKDDKIFYKDMGFTPLLLGSVNIISQNSSLNKWYIYKIRCISIAFCDKVYNGVVINESEYFWSVEKLMERAAINNAKLSRGGWSFIDRGRRPALENLCQVETLDPILRDWMIRHKVSILLHNDQCYENRERYALINPYGLGQMGFAKAIDPYTAFQELSMWIGGVLGGNSPETVQITDDKVLTENHGFDKHSFRSSSR